MKALVLTVLSIVLVHQVYSYNYDWDIIDKNGNVVHKIYNARTVSRFNDNTFVIKYKDNTVFLNGDFAEVFRSSSFSTSQFRGVQENKIGYCDRNRDVYKCGYLNKEGEIIIAPQYDYTEGFVHGYAVVGFNKKGVDDEEIEGPRQPRRDYRIIDVHGNYASPTIFGAVEFSRHTPGKGLGSPLNGVGTYIIELGQSQWNIVKDISPFNSITDRGCDVLIIKTDGFGFMDWDGNILLEPQYRAVWSVSNWGAMVTLEEDDFRIRVLVDYQGNRLLSDKKVFRVWSDYAFFKEEDKTGVYDFSQEKVIVPPTTYDSIYPSNDKTFRVALNGKDGYINLKGEILGELKDYDLLLAFSNGFGIGGVKIEE